MLSRIMVLLVVVIVSLPVFAAKNETEKVKKSNDVIAIVNGTLIDGKDDEGLPVKDAVVIIKAGKIVAVGCSSDVNIPKGSKVIDINGGTILPGFINAHVHRVYDERILHIFAQAGILTVRDLAAYPNSAFGKSSYTLRDVLNKDPTHARLIAAGPQMTAAVNGFVPPGYQSSVFVTSPEDSVKKGTQILDEGADLLKIMMESNWDKTSMSIDTARAIVEIAHARGKRASVHISLCRDVEKAIQTGTDDLAHMVLDKLSPELAKKVAKTGIIWIPTIEVWKGLNLAKNVVPNLRTFFTEGGKVALGTDFGGGPFTFDLGMPVKELGWMREAGMTPLQIIIASTRNAAEACGILKETGTLEVGKAADLFVVDGDPLTYLDTLTHIQWVIHSGVIIRKP